MAKYFGTNGIRGTIDVVSPELAYKTAKAVGETLGKKILIARDGRITGPILKEAATKGLVDAGCTVIDLGMVSTPTAEFSVRNLKADGLIIITASHNPPKDNGLKVMDKNEISLSKERASPIEKLIDNPSKTKKQGTVRKDNTAIEDHINAISSYVDASKTRGKKLLLDYGNGMAATIAPALFQRLGCAVTSINSNVDGNFPGRPSEPTKDNVKTLIELMKRGGYDAGIAWDGDGDRVIFIDEKGEFVIGDKVFALAEIFALATKKGAVVTTVATSKAIEDIANSKGSHIVYTKIGAPYLCEAMVEQNGILGGEEVGGVMWPDVSLAKDGFLTAAKIIEGLGNKKVSEWVKQIPEYHNAKTKVALGNANKQEIMERLAITLSKEKGKINTLDGVRIDVKNGWALVRPSGTENYMRVFAEAKTEKEAKAMLEKYVKIVEKEVQK